MISTNTEIIPGRDTFVIFLQGNIWHIHNYQDPELQGAGLSLREALEHLIMHHPDAVRHEKSVKVLPIILAYAVQTNDRASMGRVGIYPNTCLATTTLSRREWLENSSHSDIKLEYFLPPKLDTSDPPCWWVK